MKHSIIPWTACLVLMVVTLAMTSCKDYDDEEDNTEAAVTALKQWKVGAVVTEAAVTAYGGVDNCFISNQIPNDVWQRMDGTIYHDNPDVGRSNLRYLHALYWDRNGQIRIGEMVCHERIALDLANILKKLFNARYTIEQMVLPIPPVNDTELAQMSGNSWCFRYSGQLEITKHDFGLAVTLNPSSDLASKIGPGDLAYQTFTEAGFKWGGESNRSYFELIDYAINIKFATMAEGQTLVAADGNYWETMSTMNRDWRMQATNVTAEYMKTQAIAQVREFTDEERELLTNAVFVISQRLRQIESALPYPVRIVFVKSTNGVEWGTDAYTRDNVVYVSQNMLTKGLRGNASAFNSYVAKQLFYIVAHNDKKFRSTMLALLGFTVADREIDVAPSLREAILRNPNTDRIDSYATFNIYVPGGKQPRQCAFVTKLEKTYQEATQMEGTSYVSPFSLTYSRRILIPIDDPSTCFTTDYADDFWTTMGRNVQQFENAEECLATNFGDAVIYGETGKKYNTPELIQKIINTLTENW